MRAERTGYQLVRPAKPGGGTAAAVGRTWIGQVRTQTPEHFTATCALQAWDIQPPIDGGIVTDLSLLTGGTGYTSVPDVEIVDPAGLGTGATAHAVLDEVNHVLTELVLDSPGSGYKGTLTVNITGGGYSVIATGSATGGTPFDEDVDLSNAFKDSESPSIEITGGGGSGASGRAVVSDAGVITGVTLLKEGSGYTSAPDVDVVGGGGTDAEVTATITGRVVNLTVDDNGDSYVPGETLTVAFSGGGCSVAAVATAYVASLGNIVITLVSGGTGYTSNPTVTISGGSGSGAHATATVSGVVTGFVVVDGGQDYGQPILRVIYLPISGDVVGQYVQVDALAGSLVPWIGRTLDDFCPFPGGTDPCVS